MVCIHFFFPLLLLLPLYSQLRRSPPRTPKTPVRTPNKKTPVRTPRTPKTPVRKAKKSLSVEVPSLLWWVSIFAGMAALFLSAYGTFGYDELEHYVQPIRAFGILVFGSQKNLQVGD